jgi:hypothetical protein
VFVRLLRPTILLLALHAGIAARLPASATSSFAHANGAPRADFVVSPDSVSDDKGVSRRVSDEKKKVGPGVAPSKAGARRTTRSSSADEKKAAGKNTSEKKENTKKSAPAKTVTTAKSRKVAAAEAVLDRLATPTGERVLIEVHVGRFASRSILAYEQKNGELLVPVTQIFTLAGVDSRVQNARLQGRQSKTGPEFVYDFRTHELRHGDKSWSMSPDDVARNKEDLWVSLRALRLLLGVETTYDQGSADLEIRDAEILPVGVRALRDATVLAQRTKLKAAKTPSAVAPVDTSELSLRNRALVLDYQVTHNVQSTGSFSAGLRARNDLEIAVGSSFPFFGGVMNARTSTSNSFRAFTNDMWWTLTQPTNKYVRELSVGDVRTRGFQSREIRGFFLTNGAPVPELMAGITNYGINLPNEWQLDAFRGSNLISTSSGLGGQTDVPVSLLYGTNTIDFVAHGPNGEERMFQRSFHTPSMYVAPGTVDYAVAGGLCDQVSVCFARLNTDVRVGLNGSLAVRAGLDGRIGSLRKDSRVPEAISSSALIPYLGVSAVLRQSTVVDASVQPAVGSSGRSDATMQVRFEPNPNFVLSADGSSISTPLYGSRLLASAIETDSSLKGEYQDWMRTNRMAAYVHYAPSAIAKYGSVEAWSSVQSWNTALSSSSRLGLSAQVGSLQLRPYARFESKRVATSGNLFRDAIEDEMSATQNKTYRGLDLMFVPTWKLRSSLGDWWVRSNIEATRDRIDNWTTSLTRAFDRWRVDAAVSKRSGMPGRAWTISVVTELPQVQTSNFSSSATANSRATSITQMQGSAVYDAELKRLTLSAEPASGRSGVAGMVFLDENGDGVRQSSEAPVPGVQLYVNNKSLVSDKQGAFMVWGLPGFNTQQILVDTSSLSDPTWIPTQSFTTVRTLAGTVVNVNIPIVTAGVLRGTIRVDYASASQDSSSVEAERGSLWGTPVHLVLHNVHTGASRVVDTFSDGSFYEEGIMPGEYIISVDAGSLGGTGLASQAIRTTVRSSKGARDNAVGGRDLIVWLRCRNNSTSASSNSCSAR